MKRREFNTLLGSAAVAALWPLPLSAQRSTKISRVGILLYNTVQGDPNAADFQRGMRELGYIDGQNIAYEYRFAEGRPERLASLAAELVALKPDVILALGGDVAPDAIKATKTIPIAFAVSTDPVRAGLVVSMARPGGNATGVTFLQDELAAKRLGLLKEAAPRMARLAILARGVESDVWVEIESSAPRLAFTVVNAQANTHDEVPDALAAALRAGADSVFAPPNPINDAQRKAIVEFALANRWPAIGGDRYFVAAGGLMSYWADWVTIRRQAASYVDQILRGANPAEMPIEQPTKLELVLNLRTAAAIGLTIPQAVRLRADELIG